MEIYEALLAVGLLLISAKLLEGVFKRVGLNSIIAYATVGVLLGPVTGLVEHNAQIDLVLGMGIFLFFFLIGIEELDIWGFLRAIRGRLVVACVLSVTITMLVALAFTTDVFFDFHLGLDFTHALGVAGVLSMSSLGVVAKVLIDEGRLKEPVGVQVFTAVVIVELIALFIVGYSISEHFYAGEGGHGAEWLQIVTLIAQIIVFTVVTWLFATLILPRAIVLLQRFLRVPQLSFGILLGGLFLVVVGAEEMGLHGSLGALLFGAALSTLPYQVRRDIMPGMKSTAEGFFVPLFFASVGLYLNLDFLRLPPETVAAVILAPVVGKTAGSFIGCFIMRLNAPLAIATGLMAKGVTEIALLLLMVQIGAIEKDLFSLLVIIMLGYMLLSPLGLSFAVRRVAHTDEVVDSDQIPQSLGRFALEGIRVKDMLDRSRVHPDPSLTVKGFTEHWILPEQQDYVIVAEGQLAGVVSMSMLRFLPRSEWERTELSNVLRRNTPQCSPEDFVEDALQRMTEDSLSVLPVVDPNSGNFMGSISSYEVLEMLVLNANGREI